MKKHIERRLTREVYWNELCSVSREAACGCG